MDAPVIYFYDKPSEKVKEEHIFLNNFAHSPFIVDGLEYKTVEHFYQAHKFSDERFEIIRLAETPASAKTLAHSFEVNQPEWELKKDSIMY
jgi:predicted NAD-dependent protein-ADP-ribosyltransferase YbiA (DUF1768 family)